MKLKKSEKLKDVCYDIRGRVLDEAHRLETEGSQVTKLNIGDPSSWGFEAPEEIVHDVVINIAKGQGYSSSLGLFEARKAVMQHYQAAGLLGIQIEDIFLGNGVSELITMSLQALLNNNDEVLIPSPDYPLWTAATNLCGGKVVHYLCDESSEWIPDIADISAKITSRTRALVIINPNNPTGAVYPRECLEQIVTIAREHQLVLFSDEIYDKILYDNVKHTSIALLSDDVPTVTFNGLSKTYRVPGYRSGWLVLSGAKNRTHDYREGLVILAAMRLSPNVPGQLAIQTSIGGFQSINQLTGPNGRLTRQRNELYKILTAIPGVTCIKPKSAFYLFPRIKSSHFNIVDDEQLVLDLLIEEQILIVQGSAFGWSKPDHVRVVFLPHLDQITEIGKKFCHFFSQYRQQRNSKLLSSNTG